MSPARSSQRKAAAGVAAGGAAGPHPTTSATVASAKASAVRRMARWYHGRPALVATATIEVIRAFHGC
ncbi:MAG TPA: hypothetical protein VGQ83_07130 [Polyangia bacterium]